MECIQDDLLEVVTGMGGTGVHVLLTHTSSSSAGASHPFVPCLKVAMAGTRTADADLIIGNPHQSPAAADLEKPVGGSVSDFDLHPEFEAATSTWCNEAIQLIADVVSGRKQT